MKKYRAKVHGRSGFDASIRGVEIEKETEKSVWIGGNRQSKDSEYATYFDTWEQAHGALKVAQERYVDRLRDNLENAKSRLGNIKGMKKE